MVIEAGTPTPTPVPAGATTATPTPTPTPTATPTPTPESTPIPPPVTMVKTGGPPSASAYGFMTESGLAGTISIFDGALTSGLIPMFLLLLVLVALFRMLRRTVASRLRQAFG